MAKQSLKSEMYETLRETNAQLKRLYDYATHTRNRVLNDPGSAKKGNFTYIRLDDLDEIYYQIKATESLLYRAAGGE